MGEMSPAEREIVERAAAEPMLDQVLAWAAVNSGSRNLAGLAEMAGLLGDAFAGLPGELAFEEPATVEAVDSAGRPIPMPHGRHLHLTVRPNAPMQLLFRDREGKAKEPTLLFMDPGSGWGLVVTDAVIAKYARMLKTDDRVHPVPLPGPDRLADQGDDPGRDGDGGCLH